MPNGHNVVCHRTVTRRLPMDLRISLSSWKGERNRAVRHTSPPDFRRRSASRLHRFSTPNRSPWRATRAASMRAAPGSARNSRQVMSAATSKLRLRNGRAAASPWMQRSVPLRRASASMGHDASRPTTLKPAEASHRLKYPVPHPISNSVRACGKPSTRCAKSAFSRSPARFPGPAYQFS